MSKQKRILILLTCIAGTVIIACFKYLYPGQLYFKSGLFLIILLTIFLRSDAYTFLFGAVAVMLLIASPFGKGAATDNTLLVQYLLAICTAVSITIITLYVKKSYRSTEGQRKQMNALFEFANEGIVLTNGMGQIILANPEARRLFKYGAGEIIGKLITLLIPDHIDGENPEYWSKYYQNPSTRRMGEVSNLVGVRKNGSEFPVELSMSYYEQKRERYVLCFIIDITQRKESEKRLLQQKEQLEQITRDIRKMNVDLENKISERTLILQEALQELEKSQGELNTALNKEKELNEIKSRFVSMASHEFRTPLSTILSSASLAAKYQLTHEQDKREKHINRIKNSVQHLNDLLEDFLHLGRIEEEKVIINVGLFDVEAYIRQVFDELKSILKHGQQMQLTFNGPATFSTDKRLLKNVLINLLSNAVKFSAEHKLVEVTVINSDAKLMLQIKDHGIGIPKEDMPHLFTTFFRCKNAVNIQGTGLGLHIVKRYIDLLEGQITLSSQVNEGTVFNVGLPLRQPV